MVFEKIRDIIADKIEVDPEVITGESSFEDLKVDSLYMVEIMLSVEEEFNITIDDAEGIETVDDIVSYVESRLN